MVIRSRGKRRGMASLEVVVVTGLFLPVSVYLLYLGFLACGNLYHVIASLVNWPIM